MSSTPNSQPVDAPKSSPNSLKGKFSTIHVVAYVCSAVMSRQYSGWQIALGPGFGSFILAQVLTTMGCICHYLCLMEIWSAVPFSGGNYALSRATLGFYLGFLDGVMEALVYIAHTSLSALGAGQRLCIIFDLKPDHTLLMTLCFFIGAVCFALQTNLYILRRFFMAFATVAILILLFYCFWSLKWSNFVENASLHRAEPETNVDNWFQNGWIGFVTVLPWTLQPYAGIRSFTLLTGMTENPKVTLPRAIVISFAIIITLNILVIFVFASQPGGIEATANRLLPPMRVGWSLMFNLSPEWNRKITALLSLPATFGRVFAYLIPSGVLLHSLGNSNLMPSILMVNHQKNHSTGVLVAAVFGMGFACVLFYYPVSEIFNLAVMGTMITDCTFLYGYILLKTTYSTVPREFVSPFGMAGAIFSFLMYVLIFISSAFYQDDYFGLKFLACLIGVLTVYYFGFASKTQTLCEEEDQVFMKLHVRNYNMAKRSKIRSKQSHSGWRGVVSRCGHCCGFIRKDWGCGSARVAVDLYQPAEAVEQVMMVMTGAMPVMTPECDDCTATAGAATKVGAAEAVASVDDSVTCQETSKIHLTLESGVIIATGGLVGATDEESDLTDGVELGVLSSSGREHEKSIMPSMVAESISHCSKSG